jgi:membrane protease YdiL (CAAX protease family)
MQPAVSLAPRQRAGLSAIASFWAGGAAFGAAAVVPYLLEARPELGAELPVSPAAFAAMQALQTGILTLGLAWVGLRAGRSLGLGSPIVERWFRNEPPALGRKQVWRTVLIGVGLALVLTLLDRLFAPLLPPPLDGKPIVVPVWWKGILASFYGGFTEEVLLRLFLLTGLAWLLARLRLSRPAAVGGAVLLSALLFAAGHLPVADQVWGLSLPVVARVLLLNGLAGLTFGLLYVWHGIEAAVLAHLCTDLLLHGVLVLIL